MIKNDTKCGTRSPYSFSSFHFIVFNSHHLSFYHVFITWLLHTFYVLKEYARQGYIYLLKQLYCEILL